MKEIWKDVIGYEGYYMVSDNGKVKSLDRMVKHRNITMKLKGRILKPYLNPKGYFHVILCVNSKQKTRKIHQLMAESFKSHVPCGYKKVVDHINGIRTDNRLDNLQVISQRENASKDKKEHSSKFIGVRFRSNSKRWEASIKINGKNKYFKCW